LGPPRSSPVQPDAPKARFAAAETPAAVSSTPAPATVQPPRVAAGAQAQTAAPALEPPKGTAEKLSLATLGIPLTIGTIVTVGIAAGRTWKKRKNRNQARS
jgi:hypothetical protein